MDAGAWDGGRTRTPAMNEAADFKSAVYTNFTTQAKSLLSPKKLSFSPSAEKHPLAGRLIQWARLLALQACIRLTA
jgi:hypothetical protein